MRDVRFSGHSAGSFLAAIAVMAWCGTCVAASAAPQHTTAAPTHTTQSGLAAQVSAKLAQMYGLKAPAVRVSVVDGVVTLRGEVASDVVIDQAEDAASRVTGVAEVNNQLRVRGH